ncbi:ParB/RepB/Spo0J family partition protein [Balneatrix alpica]|uniref:Probable chromosome-partitioning protein ParB n=1 Tax=Balneatrix alpica TaxID=75684 RepID=A0ABV5ZBU3_9GAMM|nr:ParB/RepB/Spo0J family partition protein [Balneatrix alpica]
MSQKKRGLGRGLDALLGAGKQSVSIDEPQIETWLKEPEAAEGLKFIALEQIRPGMAQPRQVMDPDALEQLASSIRQQGVMQPVVVRPSGEGYELIAGERRWRASQLAGLEKIPALVREVSDQDALILALVENIQREDLNPLEQAQALERLQQSQQLTQQELADIVGKSRSAVANLLRLLQLDAQVKLRLEHGDLEMGHARALLALPAEHQADAAEEVVAKGLSVRQTEALVKRFGSAAASQQIETPDTVNPWQQRQSQLSDYLGVGVQIRQNAKGRGKMVIEFQDPQQLERILAYFQQD